MCNLDLVKNGACLPTVSTTFNMKPLFLLLTAFLIISCADSKEKAATTADRLELVPEPDKKLKEEYFKKQDSIENKKTECEKLASDILKLKNKKLQNDFFHLLDSTRKVQYPKNNQDTNIFVDLTPKFLQQFLTDLDMDQLNKTGEFEKIYHFNIAPPKFSDSKDCKDKISISFNKTSCNFRMLIYNSFFAEWCQESIVIYEFQINEDRITNFWRTEAG